MFNKVKLNNIQAIPTNIINQFTKTMVHNKFKVNLSNYRILLL